MRKTIFLLALFVAHSVSAASRLPNDVRIFVNNADACEHMAGEWDSELPERRRREISEAIKKYCAPAKRQLPLLMEKYKAHPQILKTISKHAHDSVTSYTESDAS